MKKVLFATTALVASAGIASAEVAITGSAEMGIAGGDSFSTAAGTFTRTETQFHQDIDVNFSMSGETDGGLSFGAAIDLDEVEGAKTTTPSDDFGVAIFISGGFGTLTMGDTDGALDWAVTEAGNIGNPGSIADNETGHLGYNGSYLDGNYDGQIVRYDNTFGDFGVAISVEQDHTGAQSNGFAVGFKYSADLGGTTLNIGLGHQTATRLAAPAAATPFGANGAAHVAGMKAKATGVSLGAGFGDFSAGIAYTKFSGAAAANDVTHTGIGIGYAANGLSVHANYGKFDTAADDYSGYGLAVGYDLGGGASIKAAYGSSKVTSAVAARNVSGNSFSIGLAMSF